MKIIIAISAIIVTIHLPNHSSAQAQFSGWLASFNTFKIDQRFSIHFDAQLRSSDQLDHIQTVLVRPGLNWHVKKNMILTAGYAFAGTRRVIDGISGMTPEHRLWEQFLVTHPLRSAMVAHRFRLEQRFISKTIVQNNELVNDGNVYSNRFRYFFRSIIPVKGGKKFDKGVFGALQNELFLNVGDKSSVNGKTFDQNRFYAAIGYRLQPSIDLEAGYMNQYISGRNSAFVNNHILQLAAYLRL